MNNGFTVNKLVKYSQTLLLEHWVMKLERINTLRAGTEGRSLQFTRDLCDEHNLGSESKIHFGLVSKIWDKLIWWKLHL